MTRDEADCLAQIVSADTRRTAIGLWGNQTLWMVRTRDGLFVVLGDLKIAERGRPGTPQAENWVSVQRGWEVKDGLRKSELWIKYTNPKTGSAKVISFSKGGKRQ
jgi:hypothetical protein